MLPLATYFPGSLHVPKSFLASHHLLTPGPPHRFLCILMKQDALRGHGPKARLWCSTGCLMISFLCRASGIPEKYCAQVERRALSQASAAPGQAQPHKERSSGSPAT